MSNSHSPASSLRHPTSRFLIIQTAFIGDVILATSVIEKLHYAYTGDTIDFLVRKGNESLLSEHPFINEVLVWNKKQNKLRNLFRLSKRIRQKKYDYVINLHRFSSSGLLTMMSGAKHKIGFDKNPFSFAFTKKVKHEIGNGKHEVERNHELIKETTDHSWLKPKLYPSDKDYETVKHYQTKPYVCIAPSSVWFTKQLPQEKWVELINKLQLPLTVYFLGAQSDHEFCESIKSKVVHLTTHIFENLAGKLTLLESAALMKDAQMNYVNDSAPLHMASAMNAPVTAFFCSTIPAFGFGPLSDSSKVVEIKEKLNCRPCGLHGYKTCPQGHFKCAYEIQI